MINYYLLTKPGIIMGNLCTVIAGFLLASKGNLNFPLFFATLMGLTFIMASGCVFNNFIDIELDRKMERTKNRALVIGLIDEKNAILFATCLCLIGNLILFLYTNILTMVVANIGFFVYVVLYSMWKGKTIYGTAIGSIAGAVPPVVGYCAVSNQFDAGALILFVMLVLWQMPHFFSIAMYHSNDYTAAGIPVFPLIKGFSKAKQRMVIYILGFIIVSMMLTFFNYTGYVYLLVTFFTGLIWLGFCMKGFNHDNNERWAYDMFRLSLVMIGALCLVIPFDVRPII